MAYEYLAFTICSNNYLGQALALKRSFLKHNPSFAFYVVLVDTISDKVDYTQFEPATILPVAKIDDLDLPDLVSRYNIIEFNTAVKPSAFKHLIRENPSAKAAYYLDPDLYFYDSFEKTNLILETKTAVLTPHVLSPIPRDGKMPDENLFFRFGIYNLGFLGINTQSTETMKMLDWWEDRNLKYGYNRPSKGYFVDQLWMQYAPLFYDQVAILKTYNYNMGPWNLHEREVVSIDGDMVMLNDKSRLVFYHFSKISANDVDVSREYSRHTLLDFPLLAELYKGYKLALSTSNFDQYKDIPIGYEVRRNLRKDIKKPTILKKVLLKGSVFLQKIAAKV